MAHRDPAGTVPAGLTGPRTRPAVYLTLGTVSFGATEVIRRAVDQIAGLDVDVFVAVGPEGDPEALGPVPGNVHLERFVDQPGVLDRVDVAVHHGGTGTVLGAAAAGVPQLILPQGADQFFNAELIERAGVGRGLVNDRQDGERHRPGGPGAAGRRPGAGRRRPGAGRDRRDAGPGRGRARPGRPGLRLTRPGPTPVHARARRGGQPGRHPGRLTPGRLTPGRSPPGRWGGSPPESSRPGQVALVISPRPAPRRFPPGRSAGAPRGTGGSRMRSVQRVMRPRSMPCGKESSVRKQSGSA